MKTTSITAFVAASVLFGVCFLLCGRELSSGITLLCRILFNEKDCNLPAMRESVI